MPDYSQSAAAQRNWRQKTATAPAGGGGKMVPRIVFSLLGIGLTGLLVWLIYLWFFQSKTYYACLPVVNYGIFAVPPIPFAEEDAAVFAGLGPPERSVNLRSNFEFFKTIAKISEGLQNSTMRPHDALLVSINAQGVSDNGVAYLLASDYFPDPNSPNNGRCKLSDLLQEIKKSPARLKLLILDANHLAYDPRLGMVANEFPRLLEEEVKKLNDPALWVLSSAGPLQLSQISPAAKRSIFSEAVTEGLRGAADSNRNGTVELDELFHYTQQEVPKLAAPITPEEQMPRLLQGGVGLAKPEKIAVTTYSTKKTAEEPAEKLSPEKQKLFDEDRAKLKKLLDQAWTLRDKTQDRSRGDGWTPVDYAPHLWREFQELLLSYERRYRCGTAFPARKSADDLQKEIDAWNEAEKNAEAAPSSEKTLVLSRLAAVRRNFLQSDAKKRLDRKDEQTIPLKKALQLKNDLVFWAPYYVRYHAAAAKLSDQPHALYPPLTRLLDKLLAFCEALEVLEAKPFVGEAVQLPPQHAASGPTAEEQVLESESAEIEPFRNPAANENVRSETQNLLDALKTTPRPKTAFARVEALLTTPLPSASQRAQLFDLREKLAPPPTPLDPAITESKVPGGKKTAVPNWLWHRLFEQAELELKLVLLADPTQKLSLPEENLQADNPQAENLAWLAYRDFGGKLGDFYAGLPGRIKKDFDSADPSALRPTERLLRLLDARDAEQDAEQIDAKAAACAVPLLPEPPAPPARLTISGPESLLLPRKDALPFTLTLQNSVNISAAAKVTLQFDGDLMEIVNLENNQQLRPGKQFAVAFDREAAKSLKLRARAKRLSDFKTNVEAEAVLGDLPARPITMIFRLAPPDVVDLTILAFGHPIKQSTPSTDRLRLWPYPNRTTDYAMALINHSGRARKVLVELYALPAPPRGERKFEGSPLDTSGKPKPGLLSLAGPNPIEISLPADDAPTTITFPEPKTPAGEKEKPKEPEKPNTDKPAGEQPPPDKGKPAVELTHGMVCVIRDAETKEPRWIKWIDCSPRKPRDYLQPVVRYDAAHGQITMNVAAEETLNPPPLSPENPLHVVWANAGESTAVGPGKHEAKIIALGKTDELYADVESAPNKKVWVQLTVDDYPRAFVYRVPCDNDDSKPIDPQTDRVEIRITSPPIDQPYRVPLEKPIPLEMQADAPEDAFLNEADSLQVLIVAENNPRELSPEEHRWFFNDRQVQVFLNELTPAGQWKIGTKVGDFKIPLGAGGLRNTRARIMAQISFNNPNLAEPRILRQDAVPILLQRDPPVLKVVSLDPDKPIPLGQPVVGYVTVEKAYSSIKEIQIGIDRDNSGVLEEGEKPEKLNQPDEDGKWRFMLPTKEGFQARRYTLIAKATDALGFPSKAITRTITLEPPAIDAEKKPATTSTIVGRVADQNGRPLANIDITLKGLNLTAKSDANGSFTFKDVPHGQYKLKAKGLVIGNERSTEQDVILPGISEPVKVEIQLKW